MIIAPLRIDLIPQIEQLMATGAPYITVRSSSDYWMYAHLFSSTCPVALIDDTLAGAAIAFRSQDHPEDIYIQDVVVHPEHRRQGIARQLLDRVTIYGAEHGCRRLYLTSEPQNSTAHRTWLTLGFTNIPGDTTRNGVAVITNYKGPGKDRAVYELTI